MIPLDQATRQNTFPSLSGKSSIRTNKGDLVIILQLMTVSIPFREELHSDKLGKILLVSLESQVSIPFREELHSDRERLPSPIFDVERMVSIPFREELHSDRV